MQNPKAQSQLSPDAQIYADKIYKSLVEAEEKNYHNDLVPFEKFKERLKFEVEEAVASIHLPLKQAQDLLKETFEKEEKYAPNQDKEALFSTWEQVAKEFKEKRESFLEDPKTFNSLQEMMNVPVPFMLRSYTLGQKLIEDGHYQEAQNIFFFLHYLNPFVPEYWLGEAIAAQAQGKWETAINCFCNTLVFEKHVPFLFFQIANCYFQLGNIDMSLSSLELSIKHAEEEGNQALLQQATEVRQILLKETAA